MRYWGFLAQKGPLAASLLTSHTIYGIRIHLNSNILRCIRFEGKNPDNSNKRDEDENEP